MPSTKLAVFATSNKTLDRRWRRERYEKHLENLKKVKPLIDNQHLDQRPRLPQISRNRNRLQEEKEQRIWFENQLLLHKMERIMNDPVATQKTRMQYWNDYNVKSLNREYRIKQQEKVAEQNLELARRIIGVQPHVFNRGKLENDFRRHQYYLYMKARDASTYDFNPIKEQVEQISESLGQTVSTETVERLHQLISDEGPLDEEQLIALVFPQNGQMLYSKYKQVYHKDPVALIQGKCSKPALIGFAGVMMPPVDFDTYCIKMFSKQHQAILNEVILRRPNDWLRDVAQKFERKYKKSLAEWLDKTLVEQSHKALLASRITLSNQIEPSARDQVKQGKSAAKKLYKALTENVSDIENLLVEIFADAPPKQIRTTIEMFIKEETARAIEPSHLLSSNRS